MAKNKQKIITDKQQIDSNEIIKKASDGLKYQGTVKVSIQKNKKIISTREYHNKGCPNLFKFLCTCLAGSFDENNRPTKIVLYTGAATEAIGPDSLTKENIASSAVFYDSTPVIESYTPNNEAEFDKMWSTTFHFRIPYTFIQKDKLYKLALVSSRFNKEYASAIDELFAYYLFTNEDGTQWSPIEIDNTATENFSLIIEWTMKIFNNSSNS